MAAISAKRNYNLSFESENAEFIKQNGVNLSKSVDAMIREMRRKKSREDWSIENQTALAGRCNLLESEGGTATERLYGMLHSEEY